ncbi:MAG TPA: hypothetical protein VK524_26260 [Polyangiaceae bacterium]|nr:hypothetical protein [Polyangiaceae bacterium]
MISLRSWTVPSRTATLLLGAVGALGCASQIESYTADADTGTTHASITIERSEPANGSGLLRGSVLAGFARIPDTLEAKNIMQAVGLASDAPAVGHCRAVNAVDETRPASMGYVEFMEAGDIRLATTQGATQLSARAFPTITDLISGVVYTTRDRSADAIPAGERYAISIAGNGSLGPLTLNVQAPRALDGVTVAGVPLAEVQTVSTAQPIELAWTAGESNDVLVTEFATLDGSAGTLCTFRDDAGRATLPAGMLDTEGAGRLVIRRVSSHKFVKPGIDRGELRFDFALRASLTFVR